MPEVPPQPEKVSFVIVALNEAEHLASLLDALPQQDHRPLEVIVVDGGSRDGTRDVVRAGLPRLEAAGIEGRLLEEEDFGPARSPGNARNIGVRASTGDCIALLDADVWLPSPAFARELASALRDAPAANVRVIHAQDTPVERWLATGLPKVATLGYRRDVLLAHPFHPDLGYGEDEHLWTRLGITLDEPCAAVVGGHVAHTWGEYYRQLRWYGRTLRPFLRVMRAEFPERWPAIRRQHVLDRVPRALFFASALPLAALLLPFAPWASAAILALFVAVVLKNWWTGPRARRTPRGLVLGAVQDMVASAGFCVGLVQGLRTAQPSRG